MDEYFPAQVWIWYLEHKTQKTQKKVVLFPTVVFFLSHTRLGVRLGDANMWLESVISLRFFRPHGGGGLLQPVHFSAQLVPVRPSSGEGRLETPSSLVFGGRRPQSFGPKGQILGPKGQFGGGFWPEGPIRGTFGGTLGVIWGLETSWGGYGAFWVKLGIFWIFVISRHSDLAGA